MLNKTLNKLVRRLRKKTDEPKPFDYSKINCIHLGDVPLEEFTVENLRLMISQKIGLEYFVPLALGHLERDPMASGIHYPGDLRESVQRLPTRFWDQHPDFRACWQRIQVAIAKPPTA